MSQRELILVDGYSLLFRAFYGTRFLSTADGRPTNALFGFTSMLLSLIDTIQPSAVVVALDAPGKTFRHVEYAEYKGTRRETPPELIAQFPVARDLIAALGIPSIELQGYEADDVLGTISREAEENGYRTYIVTGDLDSLQLVDSSVSVITTKQGVSETVVYDPDKVMERYGFEPKFVPDYKSIVGDASDNIPGVPGIGEKGATELIKTFGTIEELLERWEEVPEKYRKKIQGNEDQMRKSKWLATIDRRAPIQYDFAPLTISTQQMEAAHAMLESLEFRSMVRRLPKVLDRYVEGGGERREPVVEVVQESVEANIVEHRSLNAITNWIGNQPFAVVFDSAGAQLNLLSEPESSRAWIAVGTEVVECPAGEAMTLIDRAPEQWIGSDTKPLYRRALQSNVAPRFDATIAAYVLQSGRTAYGLRDLIQGYLDVTAPTSQPELAVGLWRLEGVMRDRLKREEQEQVLDTIELPLVPILAKMERLGVRVSKDFLIEFSKSLSIEIDKTQRLVYELAGTEFNIGSPKQLGEVLFEKLAIPGPKQGKTGYPTGAEILQQLAPNYEICGHVLTYRELTKLKSTYADSLPRMIEDDGRIHTTFAQTVAATGRLSSNDPNLQNIPIRTELGRQIRKAFVPADGFRLVSFDYSQIELRLLAHLCHDEALVDAFSRRVDVHSVTASLMFNLPIDAVSKEQRRLAKMLNYAVLYGVTDFGLANQLGNEFSVAEAKKLIEQYFERFPKVRAFTQSVIQDARSKGFTVTLRGRRRYFPEIHAANRNERMSAERQAVNAPIQGTAADMIKLAMIDVSRSGSDSPARMLLQVHDELLFEMPPGSPSDVHRIREEMENAMPLDVPVEVDAKAGENWSEMTVIDRD